jgi:putative serine protease PepD
MNDWSEKPGSPPAEDESARDGTGPFAAPPSSSIPPPFTPGPPTAGGIAWPTAPPSSPPTAPPTAPPVPPYRDALPPRPPSSPTGPGWPRRPQRALVIGLLVVVALLAATVGILLATRDRGSSSTADVQAAVDQPRTSAAPTTTAPARSSDPANPPVSGNGDEPIADAARAVGPSVVLIATSAGQGSGIIYDKSGLIVTNAHVVEGFDKVAVQLADGEVYVDSPVVGRDSRRDVAVVRIKPETTLTAAVLGRTDDVRVGQTAVAIGSPFGLEQTVTAGIVSAVGRVVDTTNPVEMIQTDAPINPGNSGGALTDKQGRVIGMNTSIRTAGGSGSVGVGFAIPSDTFKVIADRIVNGESLEVAFLGVRGTAPTSGAAGMLLTEVRPGSPAAQAGLKVGDLVTAIDGTKVTSSLGLSARIQLHKPKDTVELTVTREGSTLKIKVTLGTLPN